MKLARAAVLGSVLVATAAFASPALAESDAPQGGSGSQIISLESSTRGSEAHTLGRNFFVDGTHVIGYDYFIHGDHRIDAKPNRGTITAQQAKKLQKLVNGGGLRTENALEILITPECGSRPLTTWTLKTDSVTMSVPTCDGALPMYRAFPTFNEVTRIVTSTQFGS
ncbi:MAG: hypothetical protein H0T78_03195 [Longispora sp.]|nr:hypothetical protein [Longispora sp. (in: high G+C Gram-positive bacteria)]